MGAGLPHWRVRGGDSQVLLGRPGLLSWAPDKSCASRQRLSRGRSVPGPGSAPWSLGAAGE